jgi:hypothetical protein
MTLTSRAEQRAGLDKAPDGAGLDGGRPHVRDVSEAAVVDFLRGLFARARPPHHRAHVKHARAAGKRGIVRADIVEVGLVQLHAA